MSRLVILFGSYLCGPGALSDLNDCNVIASGMGKQRAEPSI